MNMHEIPVPEELMADYRAFFLKLLRRYLETGDLTWRDLGSRYVSLQQICWNLWNDASPFSSEFLHLIRPVCGHEYQSWLRKSGSHGGAARVVAAHIDNYLKSANGYPRTPAGMWVNKALEAPRPSSEWLLLEEELNQLPVNAL